jgi:hypothetical protein
MATSTSKPSTTKTAAAKPAAKKPAAKKGVTAKAAIAQVLADGTPQRTKDITAAAAKVATALKGKTPEQSLAALLYVEAKKPAGLVMRGPEKGTFMLRPVAGESAA